MKYKIVAILVTFLFFLASCLKNLQCISCIAQNKYTGVVIDTRAECDKSNRYLDGYISGFKERYKAQSDSIIVLCK